MPKLWEPKDPDLLRTWIETILEEASEELTEWEMTFIESVDRQLVQFGALTEKQENILERIYAEKTK